MTLRSHVWTAVVGILLLLAPSSVLAQNITGTKIIGGTGTPDYPTLSAAIADLNTKHASGTVTFLIDGDLTETGSPEITDTALTGANRLIIKPNTGKTPTVTFSAVVTTPTSRANAGLIITGNTASLGSVGNVTIDGSNTTGGTTRDMTFALNDGTNGRFLIKLYGNTDNVTIKNLKLFAQAIKPASASGNRTYGIYCVGLTAGAADNLNITNCVIGSSTSAFYLAIYKPDGGTASPAAAGTVISGNTLYAQHKGLSVWYAVSPTINDNSITIIGARSTYVQNSVNGIYVEAWSGICNIYNNKITLRAQVLGQTTKALYGILVYNPSGEAPAGQTANVYNNFISDIRYIGDAASNASEIIGIALDAVYQTVNVYYNTIYMNKDSVTSNPISGIRVYDDSLQTANLKNNIIVNTVDHDSAYALNRGVIATNCTIISDYNDLYVAGANANIGNYGGIKCKTLADWRTASSQDAHSVSVNPANPFGGPGQLTSLTNLHWVSAASVVFAGTPIPGFTTDIDGDTRSTTAPYMGADESGPLTGVGPADMTAPSTFALAQNYPNPFNPSTTIMYELPHASRVSLKVYNTLGQEVATLVNETKAAGVYTVEFDAAGLSTGVYFCRLEAGSFVQTRKLVLLR